MPSGEPVPSSTSTTGSAVSPDADAPVSETPTVTVALPNGTTEDIRTAAGTGTVPSVEGIPCEFTTIDPAPGEYAPPPIAAVIEWGGYEAYGGRWHEPRTGRIVEGLPPTPLVVGIVGDAAAFDEWLDVEPGRREISGIDRVVQAEVPYCVLEDAYLRFSLIPGFIAGGITVIDDRQVIEVNVADVDVIDLSDYPPFMVFSDETITFGP